MIVVKLELWPGGCEARKREIGRTYIVNDMAETAADGSRGGYKVAVCRRGDSRLPQPITRLGPKPTRIGRVSNYPRQSYNVWRLIIRALRSAFPEEK